MQQYISALAREMIYLRKALSIGYPMIYISLNDKRTRFFAVIFSILTINSVMMILDHNTFFMLGDSAVYIRSAITEQLPGDRSFVYGDLFIRSILSIFHSLIWVVIFQCLSSTIMSIFIYIVLSKIFKTSFAIAALASIVYALEPISTLHQRMILTDQLAGFFFSCFLICALFYAKCPRPLGFFLMVCSLFAEVSLRVSDALPLDACFIILPIIAQHKNLLSSAPKKGIEVLRRVMSITVVMSCIFLCYFGYAAWFHLRTGQKATVNDASNLFLLAAWAPLVSDADFPDPSLKKNVLEHTKIDLSSRFTRPHQRFAPDGLIAALLNLEKSSSDADRVAGEINKSILIHHPFGIIKLGWQTYTDFWNRKYVEDFLPVAEGKIELDEDIRSYFIKNLSEDLSNHQNIESISKWMFFLSFDWYCIVMLTPLFFLVALLAKPSQWREIIVMLVASTFLVVVEIIPVTEVVIRYLLPSAWLCVIALAILVEALSQQSRFRV